MALDQPLGKASIQDHRVVNSSRTGCLGEIFLRDQIFRTALDKGMETYMADGEMKGGPSRS